MAVLWLSAALAAIALSLASTVRGEAERSATAVDSLRSQYLAAGAVRRAMLYMDWGRFRPDDLRLKSVASTYFFDFPEGQARVEIVPEAAKLNIDFAKPEDLLVLLLNLGVDGERAREIVAAIVDWRTPLGEGPGGFDAFYESLQPPYRGTHGPFIEIEELLSVKGITPDVFFGTWDTAPAGQPRGVQLRLGLRDCVSVYGATDRVDVNTAPPPVLAAVGVPPGNVAAILERRRERPFLKPEELQSIGPGSQRLRIGGSSIFTVRATARLRLSNGQLSDMRRTVAALLKLMPPGYDASYHVLRWYDTAPGRVAGF